MHGFLKSDVTGYKDRVHGISRGLTPLPGSPPRTLIERLAVLKPYRILYIADAQDLMERAEHLQQVLGVVLDYVGAISASARSRQRQQSQKKRLRRRRMRTEQPI